MVAKDCLFDPKERTYMGYPDKGEPHFDFLNRSAWDKVKVVRETLEIWFARIPERKRKSIRSMFCSDDRQHTGALLELVTHEILCAIGYEVEADPKVDGKTPDYAATCQDATVIVECTVVQESDRDFDGAQSENASSLDTREPGVSIKVGVLGVDIQLSKATKKKAWKYRNVDSQFALVVGGHRWFSHEQAIIHALFGRNTFRDPRSFFGTSTEPKNVHVSGVLFKSFDVEGSVWDLCRPQLPWEFVHNPRAMAPMKRGVFPFATEWILESGTRNKIEPTRTLNDVLGLSDPWPPRGK
ncbi:MAG: hypothetical protein OXE05_13470 [Chloroflexi bacterium]|nr:hypothetical protein [Chloroflexota bacterium]